MGDSAANGSSSVGQTGQPSTSSPRKEEKNPFAHIPRPAPPHKSEHGKITWTKEIDDCLLQLIAEPIAPTYAAMGEFLGTPANSVTRHLQRMLGGAHGDLTSAQKKSVEAYFMKRAEEKTGAAHKGMPDRRRSQPPSPAATATTAASASTTAKPAKDKEASSASHHTSGSSDSSSSDSGSDSDSDSESSSSSSSSEKSNSKKRKAVTSGRSSTAETPTKKSTGADGTTAIPTRSSAPVTILKNREGQLWLEEDVSLLKQLMAQKLPLSEMAARVGRTIRAVERKIDLINHPEKVKRKSRSSQAAARARVNVDAIATPARSKRKSPEDLVSTSDSENKTSGAKASAATSPSPTQTATSSAASTNATTAPITVATSTQSAATPIAKVPAPSAPTGAALSHPPAATTPASKRPKTQESPEPAKRHTVDEAASRKDASSTTTSAPATPAKAATANTPTNVQTTPTTSIVSSPATTGTAQPKTPVQRPLTPGTPPQRPAGTPGTPKGSNGTGLAPGTPGSSVPRTNPGPPTPGPPRPPSAGPVRPKTPMPGAGKSLVEFELQIEFGRGRSDKFDRMKVRVKTVSVASVSDLKEKMLQVYPEAEAALASVELYIDYFHPKWQDWVELHPGTTNLADLPRTMRTRIILQSGNVEFMYLLPGPAFAEMQSEERFGKTPEWQIRAGLAVHIVRT